MISRYSSRIRIRTIQTCPVNRQVFHIVMNKVYAPAELTDEWVASNDDSYTTVDELRKGLKETMQEYYDSQYDSQVKSEIEDKLLETSEVKKYPDGASG